MQWLIPIGVFWVIAAVQFGGLLDAENGSGLQQALGLLVTFAIYLGLALALRLALGGPFGVFGSVIFPTALPLLALGWLGRLGFRLVGVRLVSARFSAGAH